MKLFTYGTLREGAPATHVLPGHTLHRYSWFPFVQPGDGQVMGNIRDVNEEELEEFDRYEGVPRGLYKRVEVTTVSLSKDKEVKAWIYLPDNLLEGDNTIYPVVNSGDWLNQ
jgi:gamma-glutamylcyclotransferase (GGCT)/AIG2-like uncharacterized protein YtfP